MIFDPPASFKVDLNDGKNFTTMEWLMVFVEVPLMSMVFQWFFTCEPLVSMVFQLFFRFQPLVSMVFPMVFSNPTIAIEWMVLWLTIDIDGLSMVLGKVKTGSQKRPKSKKKAWLVQQIPRGKQSLDRLTWPNVMQLHIFRWASLASLA